MTNNRRLAIGLVVLGAAGGGVVVVRSLDSPGPPRAAGSTPPVVSSSPTPTATPSPTAAAGAVHPVSLPALMQKRFDGRSLRLGRVLARNSAYTRYHVTYKSGTLTISGILNVPAGRGPFPALVLNHGYIDPDVYTNGRGLAREQDYLARRGYVVLHTDYRNHAQSSDDPNSDLRLRLGYAEDVINAVRAIKGSAFAFIDRANVGMLGRSMGGGVSLNAIVVQPDLVKAAVLFAPVSSDTVDNFERWTRGPGERRALARRIVAAYGEPDRNPTFWRNVSPVSFFDRISVPVMLHHGTSDDSVPVAWTKKTFDALRAAGVDATYHIYQGEEHAFGPQWPRSMSRTVAFLDRYLKA